MRHIVYLTGLTVIVFKTSLVMDLLVMAGRSIVGP